MKHAHLRCTFGFEVCEAPPLSPPNGSSSMASQARVKCRRWRGEMGSGRAQALER